MKKQISVIGIICFGIILFIGSISENNPTEPGRNCYEKISEYSGIVSEKYQSDNDYYKESLSVDRFSENEKQSYMCRDDIYAVGNNIAISKAEIQQYMDFYLNDGKDEKEAYQLAVKDAKERNALYVAAIQNGYDVTDEEIHTWLSELRNILENDTSGVYQAALEGFDSEEAYWTYEFEVYRIDLPIQNYVSAMQFDLNGASETTNNDTEANSFEAFKHELAEKQEFEETD